MSLIMPTGTPSPMTTQQAPAGRNPQQAQQDLRSYAQSKYNYNITDQDFSNYANQIGYSGGDVSEDQYQGAVSHLDRTFGGQKVAGPAPSGGAGAVGPLPANYGAALGQPPMPTPQAPPQYQNQFQGQRNALIGSILQNPRTMGQQWQDQMGEAQKESANDMAAQMRGQAQQAAVGRGLSAGSGATQAIMGNIDQNLISQLLAGRRDISTQAAIQNRQDEMGALNAVGQANAQDLQGAAFNAGNQMDMNQLGLQSWQAQENARQGQQGFGLQDWLARQNVDLENRGLSEDTRQFDKNYGLDFMRFLEGQRQFGLNFGEDQRQFNNNTAFDYFNTQQQSNDNFLNYLRGMGL